MASKGDGGINKLRGGLTLPHDSSSSHIFDVQYFFVHEFAQTFGHTCSFFVFTTFYNVDILQTVDIKHISRCVD